MVVLVQKRKRGPSAFPSFVCSSDTVNVWLGSPCTLPTNLGLCPVSTSAPSQEPNSLLEHNVYVGVCVCVCVCTRAQLCLTLCNPMDNSPPGSSVHRIILARMLKWIVMPSSRGAYRPWDQTHVSCVSCDGRQILYPESPGKETRSMQY